MKKFIILMAVLFLSQGITFAESLFTINTSYSNYIEPRPLYASVRARGIGDVVTIVLNEVPTLTDKGVYQTEKSSSILENLSQTINNIFDKDLETIDGTSGSINVKGNTSTQRALAIKDNVAVQVVQVLPNGNLLVQGKKTLVNANERVDLLVSGVVDPRWINQAGEIESTRVANLQFAMNGAGTVSRGQNEGVINRFIRMIF